MKDPEDPDGQRGAEEKGEGSPDGGHAWQQDLLTPAETYDENDMEAPDVAPVAKQTEGEFFSPTLQGLLEAYATQETHPPCLCPEDTNVSALKDRECIEPPPRRGQRSYRKDDPSRSQATIDPHTLEILPPRDLSQAFSTAAAGVANYNIHKTPVTEQQEAPPQHEIFLGSTSEPAGVESSEERDSKAEEAEDEDVMEADPTGTQSHCV